MPGLMRWPARIRPGRVVNEPVTTLDLFPTLVTLTGATLPPKPMDGIDISRLVTGEVERIGGAGIDGGREIVFFGAEGAAGLRSGKWKYLRPGLWSGTTTLFDLDADPAEKQDLSRVRPDLVKQLEARLKELT
jgi:arylsulfatase A-like enzyme